MIFIFIQDYQCSTDDLIEICELGRGAYGVVEKMRHKQTDIEMAVKVKEISCILFLKLIDETSLYQTDDD